MTVYALVLGDNIFYGQGISSLLENAKVNCEEKEKATIFGYYVQNPNRYGVVDFDENGKAISIRRKA